MSSYFKEIWNNSQFINDWIKNNEYIYGCMEKVYMDYLNNQFVSIRQKPDDAGFDDIILDIEYHTIGINQKSILQVAFTMIHGKSIPASVNFS